MALADVFLAALERKEKKGELSATNVNNLHWHALTAALKKRSGEKS